MEITRIVTVQITNIANVEDESKIMSKDKVKGIVLDTVKRNFDVDDVAVLDVQDFMMD